MYGFPDKARVDAVKKEFPAGTRVKCVHINDPWSPIYPGEEGVVEHVDDVGTIHIRWDNGRRFGAALGEDKVAVINGKE